LFSRNAASKQLKEKIVAAFADLHMKAVRRLAALGGLRPQDLTLRCQIEPVSLVCRSHKIHFI
jgi:hypothetical protein